MPRRLLAPVLLTLVLGLSACVGKTVVLEEPTNPDTGTVHGEVDDPSPPTAAPDPTSSESAEPTDPSEEPTDLDDAQGWWPPAPEPKAPAAPEETQQPAPEESTPGDGPTEETPSESPTDDDRGHYTFPGWEENIYLSRQGERPAKFADREPFERCRDSASGVGVELISPEIVECLDTGRAGPGKEAAIAVQVAPEGVHVWFVRVGPDNAEYFIDQTQAGGTWLYAACAHDASIGMLNCEEPAPVGPSDSEVEDPEEEESSPSTEDPSPSPEAPSQSSTSDTQESDDAPEDS